MKTCCSDKITHHIARVTQEKMMVRKIVLPHTFSYRDLLPFHIISKLLEETVSFNLGIALC